MAMHMILVSKSPEAPTIPPRETSRMLLIAIPAMPSATPERDTNNEMVIGMSAPPTLTVKAMPKNPLMRIPKITLAGSGTEGMHMSTIAARVSTREMVVMA